MFRLLFRSWGKGWDGSIASGVRTGKISLVKEFLKMVPFRFRNIRIVVKTDVLSGEPRLNLLIPAAVLVIHLSAGPVGDGGQFRFGRHSIRGKGDRAGLNLLFQSSHPHFEKLVEI